MVQGLGFRTFGVQNLGFRVLGLGFGTRCPRWAPGYLTWSDKGCSSTGQIGNFLKYGRGPYQFEVSLKYVFTIAVQEMSDHR